MDQLVLWGQRGEWWLYFEPQNWPAVIFCELNLKFALMLGMGCGCAPHMANRVIYWMFYDTFCIQRICNSISAPINTHCFSFLQNTNTNPQIHKYKYSNTQMPIKKTNVFKILRTLHSAQLDFQRDKQQTNKKSSKIRFWKINKWKRCDLFVANGKHVKQFKDKRPIFSLKYKSIYIISQDVGTHFQKW